MTTPGSANFGVARERVEDRVRLVSPHHARLDQAAVAPLADWIDARLFELEARFRPYWTRKAVKTWYGR